MSCLTEIWRSRKIPILLLQFNFSFYVKWFISLILLLPSLFSRVQLCATPWMAAHQAPPSTGFSRWEHWSGLPFPSPKLACMLSCFSHVWLCNPMDSSPPGSSIHRILQARILEWVAISFSKPNFRIQIFYKVLNATEKLPPCCSPPHSTYNIPSPQRQALSTSFFELLQAYPLSSELSGKSPLIFISIKSGNLFYWKS